MSDPDTQLETLLRRYQPVAPDAAMRNRVLTAARAAEPVSLPMKLWWGSIAAMFMLSALLFYSASHVNAQSVAMLATPLPPLSPEIEATIAQLGDDRDVKAYKMQMRIVAMAADIYPSPYNTN